MMRDNRPVGVPVNAKIVMAWVDVPGANTQKTQRYAAWKETLREDFILTAKLQSIDLIPNPRIHIVGYVGTTGDAVNSLARYKTPIDYLQTETTYLYKGKNRRRGCLGLIPNDRDLKLEHIRVTEIASRGKDADGYVKRRVIMYVWEGLDA